MAGANGRLVATSRPTVRRLRARSPQATVRHGHVRQTEVFAAWFADLRDLRARARIDVRIRRLSHGNPGDVKPIGGGVSELRVSYGPGYRIYFAARGDALVVLLCGGDKSTQERDIRTAKMNADQLKE